ncbi:Protein Cep78 homolog, partial [Gryllus bimaculatus]
MVASSKRTTGSCCFSTSSDKMLPTRSERRRNAPFFHQCYADLCKLRNIAPNAGVKARAGKNMLDVCGDRLKMDEWAPIIEALRHDRNLHFIAFRCRYPVKSVLEDVDTEAKARAVTKRPVFLSKFIFHLLMDSLAQCLAESTSVTCIELDGLPLTKEYMFILCKGISANTSLQTISFCNSPIGDEGCKQLCLLVRNMPSVLHLDLSNCDLKPGSAVSLSETLKYQSLQRFAESWKQSLRYREPNIESMPGLRRIILNNNVHLGDEGVNTLTDILKEDFWIRAIDLQNCGVSNMGAWSILETLEINSTLCIVDVRDNRYIDDALLHKIMVKLFHNNANKDAHEYNWIIPR